MQKSKPVPPNFPRHFFRRTDETSDDVFYRDARFVTHVDNATIKELTKFYSEMIHQKATQFEVHLFLQIF